MKPTYLADYKHEKHALNPIWLCEVSVRIDIGTKAKPSWIRRKFGTTVRYKGTDDLTPDQVKTLLHRAGRDYGHSFKHMELQSVQLVKITGWA